MQEIQPSVNKIFYIVIFISVMSINILLTWVNEKRVADYIQHQNSIASNIAHSTALEISTYIQNRRDLLMVLNRSYHKELIELNKEPYNLKNRANIREQLVIVFPEIIDFTIASKEGKIILPKISDFVVGGTCRSNIVDYSKGHLESVFIHGNPNSSNFHFDVITKLNLPKNEAGILFISLNTSVLVNILAKRSPSGHKFYLIKGDGLKHIEVSDQGHKGVLKRSLVLSDEEQGLVNANIKVAGTGWYLVSTFTYDEIAEFTDQLNAQKNIIFWLCVIAGIIVSFLFYRVDKRRLKAELHTQNQNSVLEEKVAERTQELSYQATHDELTKLINRREFERRLSEDLALAISDNTESILLYLDMDQFKIVNDTAGHAAGDELLIEVSILLKQQLRKGDTIARLGGDEFGILLRHCDLKTAENIAEQLRSCIQKYHYEWEGYSFHLGVSIGIIEMNADSPKLSELLSLVDAACYLAKEQGRNQYYVYREDDSLFEAKHSAMYRSEMALTAIKEKRLELHGQKIFNLAGSESNKHDSWYEVLVRIKNNDGSLLYPDSFIPALETFGHIDVLDQYVLQQAILFLKDNKNFKLSVNLSGLSIVKPELINQIQISLNEHDVEPCRICFEITESATIGNLSKVKIFIRELHQMGCLIALDDFGTGMSSFSYLSNLDVDYIKLDGSFVKDINRNSLHATMVESINSIVQSMGKFVIAEYVETSEVSQQLKGFGVSLGQGYFIHRPEKLDDISNA